MHFWLKRYLCFCHVWMKFREVAEKILLVSGSFWSNFKFYRMMDFAECLWGWKVRVNGILFVFSFWEVCSADCRSICWARWWPAWTTVQDSHVCRRNHTFHKDDKDWNTENNYLLLTEFEGRTVSYEPSFFLLDRRGKTRIRKVQYGLRKRG